MKKLLAVILALMLVFAISATAFGDFGEFAGDSDWGGGWDSGGWDSGYDSWDYDYDYGDNYYYSGGSSYDGETSPFEIIIIVIVIAVIIGAVLLGGKTAAKGSKGRPVQVQRPAQPAKMVNDLAGLKARDPGFSESKFLSDAANLYVRMQNAWTDKDLTLLQTRFAEELYAKSDRQVQSYIRMKQTNHVDRISVLSTDIVGCTKDSKNDIITVQLVARIVDYVTDDNTGKVLRGDPNKELFMTYQWTFIRTLGKVTSSGELVDDKHCPNCGAPIDLNRSAVCEYCGSVVTSSDYDWIVSDIKGISQRSSY